MTLKRMNGLQKSLGKSIKSLRIKPPSVFMRSMQKKIQETQRTYLTYLKGLAHQINWAILAL
jgi:hypothetical protein